MAILKQGLQVTLNALHVKLGIMRLVALLIVNRVHWASTQMNTEAVSAMNAPWEPFQGIVQVK